MLVLVVQTGAKHHDRQLEAPSCVCMAFGAMLLPPLLLPCLLRESGRRLRSDFLQ